MRVRAGVMAGAAALALAGGASTTGFAEPPPLPRLGAAPNFALTTQQNDRLWLTTLRGRVVVLTFTCTACGACPGLLPSLVDLSRAQDPGDARRTVFVAISVAPQEDSVMVLRRFGRGLGVYPPAWFLLTGAPAEVDVVRRWYGVEVKREAGRLTHTCAVLLIDGAGAIRARYGGEDLARLRGDLEGLLVERGGS